MLRTRYTERAGNGEAWAFVTHVRNAAGFDASRTVDAIAMALWPSRGLVLNGFEVKVSRSDWLRELKKPAKAEQFARLVDFWWLAVADDKVVQDGELPEGWGLLVARGSKLFCVREAKALHDLTPVNRREAALPEAFGRSFLASMLRAACRVAEAGPAEIEEARELQRQQSEHRWTGEVAALKSLLEQHEAAENAFARATGLAYGAWTLANEERAAQVGRAVQMVLNGDDNVRQLQEQLEHVRDQAARVLAAIERQLEAVPA